VTWPGRLALLVGILAGALASTSLEGIQNGRLMQAEAPLAEVDQRLRELAPVKAPVDSYRADRERLEEQVRWIEEARARQRCPGPVLAGLDLARRTPQIESVALEGQTLAILGRAGSEAEVEALADSVRAQDWSRSVSAAGRRGGRGRGLRFGLVATIELPACRPQEAPVPPREKER
jgi:hypothetical protein